MSAMTMERAVETSAPDIRRISTSRVISVELRKMFDTRSGFWLLMSIAITSTLATGSVILWAPDSELTYETFGGAIGFPMAVILPIIAILSVTGEWSQRNGLTTFTLVPHRGRVIGAKLAGTLIVGVASMFVALAIGALGNVVGTAITDTPLTWNVTVADFSSIVVGNVLGMLLGFTLGVLLRNSAAAIVAYFVVGFVLYPLSMLLAQAASWWNSAMPWVDFNDAQSRLFEGGMTQTDWAHLATASGIWIALPLVIGLTLLMRSEVK